MCKNPRTLCLLASRHTRKAASALSPAHHTRWPFVPLRARLISASTAVVNLPRALLLPVRDQPLCAASLQPRTALQLRADARA